ncbi:bacterioferritin [Candidatus Poriferisodalis sp.]|uniref:bacterioferritin n=1 Tax=Candidatus Poriferisodalis sp. TaxID=3101277 RepID=UPI003B52467D
MRGSPEVIEFLNEALTAELTAINQYFAASKIADNWGYGRLASKYHEESIEEMRDAEKLIERILLLDALPNMQRLGMVMIGETVPEQLSLDRQLEEHAIERYRAGVRICLDEGDAGTRELLEHLLVGEEEHLDWIETQQSLIDDIGVERYLLAQIGDAD